MQLPGCIPVRKFLGALLLFFTQLIANFAWSPLFFGQHQVTTALYVIIFILMLVGVMAKMGGTAIAFMLAIVAHHRPAELEWHEQQ